MGKRKNKNIDIFLSALHKLSHPLQFAAVGKETSLSLLDVTHLMAF